MSFSYIVDIYLCLFVRFVFSVSSFCSILFFFLMIRRPPRSTQSRSSAASDVYKRQIYSQHLKSQIVIMKRISNLLILMCIILLFSGVTPVSYTHLRAHETVLDLVCRLLLEKKKHTKKKTRHTHHYNE